MSANLLSIDCVHGAWAHEVHDEGDSMMIDGVLLSHSCQKEIHVLAWDRYGVDLVLEVSGSFRTPEQLAAYFKAGVKKVLVAVPVKSVAMPIGMPSWRGRWR